MEKLAEIAGLSPSRFKASFKEEFGVPPAEYALRARVVEAHRRLSKPDATVIRVAFDLGFSFSQYFASVFRRFTNFTPREAMKRDQLPRTSRPSCSARKSLTP